MAEEENTTPGPKVGRSGSRLSSKAGNGTLKKSCVYEAMVPFVAAVSN